MNELLKDALGALFGIFCMSIVFKCCADENQRWLEASKKKEYDSCSAQAKYHWPSDGLKNNCLEKYPELSEIK